MRLLKPILLITVLIAAAIFSYQWLSQKKDKENAFVRIIKDTIDITHYGWHQLPSNPVGITRGDLSYLISDYHANTTDQKATTEVTCLPVENADNLLAAANFQNSRYYIYRGSNIWYRQNKKNHQVTRLTFDTSQLIGARIMDVNQLLLARLDTPKNSITFTWIDTSGTILSRQSILSDASGQENRALMKRAEILQVDSIIYLFDQKSSIVLAYNQRTHHKKTFNLTAEAHPTQAKSSPSTADGILRNRIVRYDFDSELFYVLDDHVDTSDEELKATPVLFTSYLDFYNKDFSYQYSLAFKNLNPVAVSDMAIFNHAFYIIAARSYLSGNY